MGLFRDGIINACFHETATIHVVRDRNHSHLLILTAQLAGECSVQINKNSRSNRTYNNFFRFKNFHNLLILISESEQRGIVYIVFFFIYLHVNRTFSVDSARFQFQFKRQSHKESNCFFSSNSLQWVMYVESCILPLSVTINTACNVTDY